MHALRLGAQVVAALDDVDAELVRLRTQANVPPAPDKAVGGRVAAPLRPVVLVDPGSGCGETTLTRCCRHFILFRD